MTTKSKQKNDTVEINDVKTITCMAREKFTLNDKTVNQNDIIELTKEEYDGALFNKLVVKMEE